MAPWLRLLVIGVLAGASTGSILAGDFAKGITVALIAGLMTNDERLIGLGRDIGRRLKG
jgi:hypothetical protein